MLGGSTTVSVGGAEGRRGVSGDGGSGGEAVGDSWRGDFKAPALRMIPWKKAVGLSDK